MISDRKYRAKLVHRGRGLADLERHVGGVLAEIDATLARRPTARVLELGCGYGTALIELRAHYGERVELHGVNRQAWDGNRDILLRNAADRGFEGILLPTLHFADVADGLPFPTATFDLVYSQVAWLYFPNKIAVLREVSRVLDVSGVAKIDVDEIRPGLPNEYARLTEIWEAGRLVPLGEYAMRFGMTLVPAADGEYLRFAKCPGFGDDLELVCEIDLARLYGEWNGIKCVYRVTGP